MKYFLIIFLSWFTGLQSQASSWVVGPGKPLTTIRAALLKAQSGDTVWVLPGLYREGNLVISQSIALIGRSYPVIDGEYKYENISVKAGHVLVEGFRIIQSGVSSIEDFAGIKIYNQRDVVIRNNILEKTFFGIYMQYAVRCTIEGNVLKAYGQQEQQSGNGIHCWKSDSLHIRGNRINGHRDGIYFEFVTHSVIEKNISERNLRYGLHFMFSDNDAYIGNTFMQNGAGVAVMFTHHVRMFDNDFIENWGDGAYGLLLKEISDAEIGGNRIFGNTVGIFMEGSNRLHLQGNQFRNNGWAMKVLANCVDIRVRANNFIGNSFDVGTNGSLVLNSFNGNYWDKYEGYDLNRDRTGDIPYRPVSLYAMIVEQNPSAMILFRSFMASLLDKTEKVVPTITPENLKDNQPRMKPVPL